ncbi:MAG: hypothetical protein LBO72_01445 [Helicobacteraceae bacterium]|jgi:hypothetical protein|nr:hypothetical protein [Helicobacteraceae bacterium]
MKWHLVLWANRFSSREETLIRDLEREVKPGETVPHADMDYSSYCNGLFEACKRYWKQMPPEIRHLFFVLEVSDDELQSKAYCYRPSVEVKLPDFTKWFNWRLSRCAVGANVTVEIVEL